MRRIAHRLSLRSIRLGVRRFSTQAARLRYAGITPMRRATVPVTAAAAAVGLTAVSTRPNNTEAKDYKDFKNNLINTIDNTLYGTADKDDLVKTYWKFIITNYTRFSLTTLAYAMSICKEFAEEFIDVVMNDDRLHLYLNMLTLNIAKTNKMVSIAKQEKLAQYLMRGLDKMSSEQLKYVVYDNAHFSNLLCDHILLGDSGIKVFDMADSDTIRCVLIDVDQNKRAALTKFVVDNCDAVHIRAVGCVLLHEHVFRVPVAESSSMKLSDKIMAQKNFALVGKLSVDSICHLMCDSRDLQSRWCDFALQNLKEVDRSNKWVVMHLVERNYCNFRSRLIDHMYKNDMVLTEHQINFMRQLYDTHTTHVELRWLPHSIFNTVWQRVFDGTTHRQKLEELYLKHAGELNDLDACIIARNWDRSYGDALYQRLVALKKHETANAVAGYLQYRDANNK